MLQVRNHPLSGLSCKSIVQCNLAQLNIASNWFTLFLIGLHGASWSNLYVPSWDLVLTGNHVLTMMKMYRQPAAASCMQIEAGDASKLPCHWLKHMLHVFA